MNFIFNYYTNEILKKKDLDNCATLNEFYLKESCFHDFIRPRYAWVFRQVFVFLDTFCQHKSITVMDVRLTSQWRLKVKMLYNNSLVFRSKLIRKLVSEIILHTALIYKCWHLLLSSCHFCTLKLQLYQHSCAMLMTLKMCCRTKGLRFGLVVTDLTSFTSALGFLPPLIKWTLQN